jgi:hemolysin activation/secretion protein
MRNSAPHGRGRAFERILALLAIEFSLATVGAQVLPPPPLRPDKGSKLSTEARLFVRGYRFEGNHAFSDLELAKVTEPFTNRELSSDDLEQARRAVTLHYISHGYVSSGAVIPDQKPTNGIVTLRIVEGVLSRIDLHGNKWLSDSYIKAHLWRWSAPPLNMNELQEGLQLLRQNPNVRQINAELKPGTAPGLSLLDARVEDQQPFRLGLQFDNQRPTSVGSSEIWLLAADLNLTGHSDPLELKYGIASGSLNGGPNNFDFSGLDNIEGSYVLPLTRWDTTLDFHGSRLNTSLIEEPFPPLGVKSLTDSYGFALRQPVYQTANQEVALAVDFDRRENNTWLLDQPFNISPGAVNGKMVVSVLRLSQEWLQRGQNHVLALRSTFNIGLDVFGATDNGIPGQPNGEFVSWVGQGQYIQRLFNTQNQLLLRLAGQWTGDPLLALEEFSVGGFETVRGYLENQLVRDRSLVASVEFRLPLLFNKAGAGILSIAPFFDFGGGWDVKTSSDLNEIYSTGLGLLYSPNKHVSAQLYWGYRLRHVEMPSSTDAQTLGLDFRINVAAF